MRKQQLYAVKLFQNLGKLFVHALDQRCAVTEKKRRGGDGQYAFMEGKLAGIGFVGAFGDVRDAGFHGFKCFGAGAESFREIGFDFQAASAAFFHFVHPGLQRTLPAGMNGGNGQIKAEGILRRCLRGAGQNLGDGKQGRKEQSSRLLHDVLHVIPVASG